MPGPRQPRYPHMSREFSAVLSLLGISAIWGLTFPMVKAALSDVTPCAFLSMRFLTALIVSFMLFRKDLLSASMSSVKHGVLAGVSLAVAYILQTVGLKYTTASKSGFITGLYVAFTPPLSKILLKSRISRLSLLAVFLAFAGLSMLSEVDPTTLTMNYGDFLTLLCAIAYAVNVVSVGKYSKTSRPTILSTVQIAVVFAASTLAWLFMEPIRLPTSASAWFAVLFTAVFATSLALLAQNYAQRYVDPTRTALIFIAEPIFAALFSYLFLGETLTTNGLLGAALITFGILISTISRD